MSDEKVISNTEQTRESFRPPARGKKHMAVSGHALATHAAMRILDKGGNAVDAGVAGTFCLAVLQPDMVSFAGVAPLLVHHAPSNENREVSGVGCWPKAASTEFFLKRHAGKLPAGILRTVVPALPDACIQALQQYGTMSFAEVAADALDLAAGGFPMHQFLRNGIRESEAAYRQWAENKAIFLPGDRVPEVDEPFVQEDLGKTLAAMIEAERNACAGGKDRVAALAAARDEFYTGGVGSAITNFHKANGGLLRREDMAAFSCEVG